MALALAGSSPRLTARSTTASNGPLRVSQNSAAQVRSSSSWGASDTTMRTMACEMGCAR
jgi:hypothetical protein